MKLLLLNLIIKSKKILIIFFPDIFFLISLIFTPLAPELPPLDLTFAQLPQNAPLFALHLLSDPLSKSHNLPPPTSASSGILLSRVHDWTGNAGRFPKRAGF
jgi:hypothetical protein